MPLFVTKTEARTLANDVDKIAREIAQITNSDIDRVCDKIDAELNSCGREISNSIKILQQIKPLVDKLVLQVGDQAPEHVKVLVQSICQEIISKVMTSIDNQEEVRRNINDVDKHTDKIDSLTDQVTDLTKQIDEITDKVQ